MKQTNTIINLLTKISDYIRLMRIKQYIKNLFIFASIIFSNNILNISLLLNTFIAFVCFCLISSSAYALNDAIDMDKDKKHPKKRNRPVASGRISKRSANILFVVLALISICLSTIINFKLTIILILYLINNILYSLKLKNIILLDVFSISLGFILRVYAGCVAIDVRLSNWIILCTFFLSLYLALGKRKKEIIILKDDAVEHRKILEDYDIENLNQMMIVILSSTIVCYALYSTSNPEKPDMIFTTIFVVYGVLRYNYIINKTNEGNPTDIVLKDNALKINVILWVIACLIILIF
ncbi:MULTISPECIES: decaprenyl-phosphate phosphoribosyltransferase [unclassified Clostridioides]|uniref:decaprenyl-phosphate phosphoribosyltransferase n=1 Tax=unclassified Clostridioides TaxID=2635829 RepID=UPI001D10D3CF|nr:decaprenyl-phosphate phosphoribosyltransferase [Clostridioides sp. ZZV14-6150]MCC0662100.1 decaprenyl-phosphate phosphoribosyltransferase [Clostridioides sp. ZZV14-6154]MCC0669889.1 decaprenyl-phosphate phosphoribosyltransferase [Clostridioides sp. ZZV14-6153]MCC0719791.1 decaprenyl-phosphate phosphoribosyltransferase [Clostridioides sp. ZZV14-6105]MCC0722139.1 decaprenyl-phosphate phosphoribosyltransferase [Clostridioides sp. ZZV14-6104]MCC0728228.1 decaprenyl-phosphate phosphoribosyltrans